MRGVFFCLLALLLSACGKYDTAAMPIQGSDHSLTLIREKNTAWSNGWELSIVVSHMPDCSRRHHLKPASDGPFKMDIFRTENGRWVLRQGKKWYVAESESCQLQAFETKPENPGTPVGSFDDKSGTLKFTISPDLKKPAAPAPQ